MAIEAPPVVKRMNRLFATPAYVLGWVLEMLKRWANLKEAMIARDDVLNYLVQEFPGVMYQLTVNLASSARRERAGAS